MPIILQPVDQIAHAELAQRLACWAKTEDGLTDRAVVYQSCCVSPTGQTLGRWVIPEDLCAIYGPFNFTGNEGEVIPCPSVGSAEYLNYYIYDDDVDGIDPNTCVEVILAAPLGLTSPTQGPTTVDLEWDAVAGAETYIVRWSLAGADDWTELPPTALLTAEVSGLTDETSYDFQVQAKAVGAVDSPWSATLTQETTSLGELAAPTGVAAPSATGTTIDVTWNEVQNATSYTIEWSLAGVGTWTTATSTDTTYTITGLALDTSYDIRIKATAPGWTDSPYSATVTTSTHAQLAAPAGLTSPSQSGVYLELSWTAVPNATRYVMRRSLAGQNNWIEMPPVDQTGMTATGLTAGTSYDFQVKAEADDFVDSPWSTTLTQSTAAALATPVLGTSGQTDTSVTLTWGAITNATSYTLQWAPTAGGQWSGMPNTAATSQTVTGLTPGTSYKFRVLAHAFGWTDSAWSAEFTQPTWPALLAPANFAAGTPTLTTMPLTWTAAVNADSYTISVRTSPNGTWEEFSGITGTSTTITDLVEGTAYDFRIKTVATGFADSGWSTIITASTAMTPLAAPTGFISTAQTDTAVDLSWDVVPDATLYVMRWSPAGAGTWTELPPGEPITGQVTGLTASTSYDFQVKAQAPSFADSPWSTTVTESTLAPLAPPANFAAGAPTTTTMPLSWDSAVNTESYTIAWSPAGAGTWTDVPAAGGTSDTVTGLTAGTAYDFRIKSTATGWNDSAWSTVITAGTALAAPTGLDTTDGLLSTSILMQWDAVTGAAMYVMRWSPAGAGTWTELAPTADTNDTVTGLTPETSYDLQVKATGTGVADSAWSATHTASTTAVPQLAAPTGMGSLSQTTTSVDLTWTAIVGADTYVVRHSPAGAGTWTEEAAVATNADTVASLTADTSYDFQVKAQGSGWVDSDWSTTFTQSTHQGTLATPTNMASPSQTSTSVSLTWDAVPNATNYEPEYALAGSGLWIPDAMSVTNSVVITGLNPSTSYDFRIRATAVGWTASAYSATFTQSTTA